MNLPMNQKPHQNHPKLWAVIPAAGTGSRFSQTALKQYQYIANQTVLEHSIQALFQLPLSGCMVAIHPEDHFANTLNLPKQVKFCHGGKERMDSVLAALYALRQENIANDDYVLVHDAARPCLHAAQIAQILMFVATNQPAAIVAVPVRDTLKKSNSEQYITQTVSRETLWQAQTPQIVKYAILVHALEYAKQHHLIVTDEASALEMIHTPVALLHGRADNLKITYPEDLELATMILDSRNKQ